MLTFFSLHGFRGVDRDMLPLTKYQAIIGGNGSGKTHILEAIHLLSGGSLHYFQAPRDEDAFFSAHVRGEVGDSRYSLSRKDRSDLYSIQGAKVTGKKYRESLPYRSVFISPFDMNLLYFAPAIRRDYIDSILMRSFAQFSLIRRDYEAVMRQRNALLKRIRDGEAKKSDLDYWNRSFAEKANLYMLYRKKWYHFVCDHLGDISLFLEKYTLSCVYESKLIDEEDITEAVLRSLDETVERDIITGHTHIGPHLDDFSFHVQIGDEQIDASLYLSRGENKMLLLGLKQLEIFFIKKQCDLPVILLFDDLFAELDMNHAEKLIEKFNADQIILTTQRDLPKNEKWNDFSCINLTPE